MPENNQSPVIVPVFTPHEGCPGKCVFCNQHQTADPTDGQDPVEQLAGKMDLLEQKGRNDGRRVEIAFFGGNFTGIEHLTQKRMLSCARFYLERGLADDIRISARPDSIGPERLRFLADNGVSVIELGVQSLADSILKQAARGHTSYQVALASHFIRDAGMKLGFQLMVGLPGETLAEVRTTIERTLELAPDFVRVSPTLVLKGALLEKMYLDGTYQPLSMDAAVELCASVLVLLAAEGIPVIRMGLHPTGQMLSEGGVVAGPFHPAFRHLVEDRIYLRMAQDLLDRIIEGDKKTTSFEFSCNPKDLSNMLGMKKGNVQALEMLYPDCTVSMKTDPELERHSLRLIANDRMGKEHFTGMAPLFWGKFRQ